jgi:hypothetical protein
MKNLHKRCILHAGTSKTGTTAIQKYLAGYPGKNDEFVYSSCMGINSSFELIHLFHTEPTSDYNYQLGNLSANKVVDYRKQALDYINRQIKKAIDENKILIFSWEGCWGFPDESLVQLRQFMESNGFTVELVVYMRPLKEWIESIFQQNIKAMGLAEFNPVSPVSSKSFEKTNQKIQKLEAIFGATQVYLYKYAPSMFDNGNVVQHFCQKIGITHKESHQRANDSLSLPALKLLYAYNQFGPALGYGPAMKNNHKLIEVLTQLHGPSMRLHSSLIEPVWEHQNQERTRTEQRLGGIDMSEDIYQFDTEEYVIKNENDMYKFDTKSLEWLAKQVNAQPVSPATGREAAEKVAIQVHSIYRKMYKRASFSSRISNRVNNLYRSFAVRHLFGIFNRKQ